MKQKPPDTTPYHSIQKSDESRLRQDSTVRKPSDKLRYGGVLPRSGKMDLTETQAEKEPRAIRKARSHAEKAGKRLDCAKERMANRKPIKPPGIMKTASVAAKHEAYAAVHRKIYSLERDNAGVEAAHRAELAGERAFRAGSRFLKRRIRSKPQRQTRNLEKKSAKANTNLRLKEMALDEAEMKKDALSRYEQKKRLRKQYNRKAKEAASKTAKKAGEKAASVAEKTGRAIVRFAEDYPIITVLLLVCFMIVVIMQSCAGSAITFGNSISGSVSLSTYPSEDKEMLAAEAAYSALESTLQDKLDNFETLNPGYDEYHYDLDETGHDPYVLISILSAMREGAWTLVEVQDTLTLLFGMQYTLTATVKVGSPLPYRKLLRNRPGYGHNILRKLPGCVQLLHLHGHA